MSESSKKEIIHAERVDLAYNPTTGRFEVMFTFDEVETYRLVFQAEDAGGQRVQPVTVFRTTVYLPLVARRRADGLSTDGKTD